MQLLAAARGNTSKSAKTAAFIEKAKEIEPTIKWHGLARTKKGVFNATKAAISDEKKHIGFSAFADSFELSQRYIPPR